MSDTRSLDDILHEIRLSNIPGPRISQETMDRVTQAINEFNDGFPEPEDDDEPDSIEDVPSDTNSNEDNQEEEEESTELSPEELNEVLLSQGIGTVSEPIDVLIGRTIAEEEYSDPDEYDYDEDEADEGITDILEEDTQETEEEQVQAVEEEEDGDHGIIPENSPTLLIHEETSRFSGTEWFEKMSSQEVKVVGVGGIGSWLALQLSRLGLRAIYMMDNDKVESGNLSGQLYGRDDIGKYKVDALSSFLFNYGNTPRTLCYRTRFTSSTITFPVIFCGLDNMEARKLVFTKWKLLVEERIPEARKYCLFIDGRLAIDTLQIFCIRGDDEYSMELYQKEYLFSGEEAEETQCSLKQTSYMAGMIASLMTNLYVNHIASVDSEVPTYNLPFYTQYHSQHMIFKISNS